MINNIINEINNYDKVLILGFGKEGRSTYNLIRKYLKDKFLYIADNDNKIVIENDKNIELILGDNYLDNLDNYDLIIKSPGVNFKEINYESFKDKITSQTDLFLRFSKCKTIGITGTKGKSTTSSLTYHVLASFINNIFLVGNIGTPIFDRIEEMNNDSTVVIELAVHQLQFIKKSPNISVLLNIYPEHLDLYKSYEDYKNTKLNIFNYQDSNNYRIIGLDSEDLSNYINNNTYTLSKDKNKINKGIYINNDELYFIDNNTKLIFDKNNKRQILGEHNLYNIGVIFCICSILNIDFNKIYSLIEDFKPLAHRLEYIGTYNNIKFYDDSISTIPETTINCINSIEDLDTLIVGGFNREIDLSKLIDRINKSNIKNLICMKDTGYIIGDNITNNINIYKVNNMTEAVEIAYENTDKNKSCVLSPAAASYNMYKSFEERGDDFKENIIKLSK